MKLEAQEELYGIIWDLSEKYRDRQDYFLAELKTRLQKKNLSPDEKYHANYLYGLENGCMHIWLALDDHMYHCQALPDPKKELRKLRDVDPQTKGKRAAWRMARRDFRRLFVLLEEESHG